MYFDLAPADVTRTQRAKFNAVNVTSFVNQRAMYYGYSGNAIRGRMRHREYVQVRARIAEELRDLGYSLPAIGRALGRDHSTVMNLLKGGRGQAAELERRVSAMRSPSWTGVVLARAQSVKP